MAQAIWRINHLQTNKNEYKVRRNMYIYMYHVQFNKNEYKVGELLKKTTINTTTKPSIIFHLRHMVVQHWEH